MVKNILITFVAVQHIFFLVLEMFFWTKPLGLSIFRMSLDKAEQSAVVAANQGLYNGFLAAGLVWSLMHPDPAFSKQLSLFFLSCVIVAGAYGAYSVSWRILLIQAVPAFLAILFICFTK